MVNESNNRSTMNLNRSLMRLRDDLVFAPQSHRGETYYHIESPDQSCFYRIGFAEYVFVSLLDGQTTFAEALALTAQRLGPSSLTTTQATAIYLWLLEKDLGKIVATNENATPFAAAAGKSKRLSEVPNPFWIKLPLGNPDKFIRALLPALAWLFSPIFTTLGLTLITVGALSIGFNWQQFLSDSEIVFSPSNWLWMTISWIALKVAHELAHAVACRRLGGEVKELGIVFVLFAPLAYVDVTSSWRVPSKWSRVQVAAAGIYVELLIAAIAALAWQYVESKFISHMLYNLIFMASISTILFNANPLMRFDGYFILSDLLEIPNLSAEGGKAVRRQASNFLFGETAGEPRLASKVGWYVCVYGWAAAMWQMVVCVSLIIASSVLFHGAGIALSVLAVVSWIAKPAVRSVQSLIGRYNTNAAQVWRAISLSSLIGIAAGLLLLGIPSPATVMAPGIVEYQDVEHVRSLTGGFIVDVLVADCQDVDQGDLLLVLKNSDVSNMYHDLELAIAQGEIRHQTAVDRHDTSAAQVAQSEIASLTEKLAEAARRYHALEVRAPVSGRIIKRSLQNAIDTYVQEGEHLLSIGNETSKELIVSVEERDFDSVVPRVGQPVKIHIGSLPSVVGTLVRLEPRASTKLIHPALSAIEGGPLEVVEAKSREANGNAETELTEPRFRAVVAIPYDRTDAIFSGQRASVIIGWRHEPIGITFYKSIADWVRDKLSTQSS